ncbi:hypothetical protein DDJ45_10355 [Mycobacteroides abscessus]|nr:hypothetical protein DDJ45_10355 [Mycobacteroides abscessus]
MHCKDDFTFNFQYTPGLITHPSTDGLAGDDQDCSNYRLFEAYTWQSDKIQAVEARTVLRLRSGNPDQDPSPPGTGVYDEM